MAACLHNFTFINNDNHICVTDGVQSMRNDEARSALHYVQQRVLNMQFGSGINAARRFV
ncbi:hypothetical protein D3C84_1301970 [compost metagenome]